MEQFVNTFQKGMNSDMQLVYQPDGTYRYLKNCDIISQDGNNYAIKDCLGNTLLFTLNTRYADFYTNLDFPPTPLIFLSFPNKLVVISTNNEGSGGYGEIGIITSLPYGEGIQPKTESFQPNAGYTPLYHHASLNFTKLHRMDGFTVSENELINRFYVSDNYNEPKVFNVSDPVYSTYIASGSLVNGTQYMVLQGAVEYPVGSGDNYGPGLILGNVITAGATANYTATTGTSPTPLVIKYIPYQLLDWTPSRKTAETKFKSYGTGSLYCGDKMYFTRLTSIDNSYSTTWSYGTTPIHVGTENNPVVGGIPAYHNFVGGGTANVLLNSNKSVFLNVSNIDTTFGFIELACAEFDQSELAPRVISIVSKVAITGASMVLEHTGTINLGELTLGDITLFPASILKIKALNTNKNFNLAGNITERKEFELDLSGVTCTSFEYPMNVHGDPQTCSIGGLAYKGAYPDSVSANPAAGTVSPWSRWEVIYGDGVDTVTYNGNTYVTGEVIVGVSADDTIVCVGAAGVRPCVTRNRFTTAGGDRVEDSIQLTTGFWTYKDPAAHHHVEGYWSGETYRYGLEFDDLKGNPFYVKWLKDFTFPTLNSKGGSLRSDLDASGNQIFSLNPSGIKFSNIKLPPAIAAQVSGMRIVRAERDPIAVTQGLVTQCGHTGATPDVFRPGSWNDVISDDLPVADKKYVYLCPDSLINAPLKASIGIKGDQMVEANWYKPYIWTVTGGPGITAQRASGGEEQIYTKFVTYQTTDGRDRTRTIDIYATEIAPGQDYIGLTNGDIFDNGNMKVGAAAGTIPNPDCIGGVNYTLDGHEAQGCKKSFFTLDSDFPHYGTATGYTSTSGAVIVKTQKIVMNYTKAGKVASSLYGGTSDSAKANTLYISTGHYQPINAAVLAQLPVDGSGNYIFNNVEVFGGDCFTSLIDIGYALWDNGFANKYSYSWFFPCECNGNYDLRRGKKTSNVGMYYTGTVSTDSIVYTGPASEVRLEEYLYNPGYSSETDFVSYPALPVNYINAGQFQARMRYAGPKFPGEIIDSFRTFAAPDYKDLSLQNGRINNIKVKKDTVIVWQDWALNTVPILERQTVSGLNGDATNIGTGGVIDRFDILDSYFGNQHQWGVTETEFGFIWFDMHRKGAVIIDFNGSGIAEVSFLEGQQSFFNEAFVESIGNNIIDSTNILNSQDFSETSDRPLMGVGITGVYDPKNKMAYLVFKYKARKVINVLVGEVLEQRNAYQSKDFTIGYRHDAQNKMAVGFYDWNFSIGHNHNQWVLTVNNPKTLTQFVPTNISYLVFTVGETLAYSYGGFPFGTGEYICIANVTLNSVDKYPDGIDGTTYWKLVNKTSQIWVNNQPTTLGQAVAPDYQYNKYFGKVVDNVLTIIINPNNGMNSFFVGNIEQLGPYNVNYTTIETEGNNNQSASDVSIRGTDLNYRFVFDRIKSSLPRRANGARIFSNYLKVTFTKHNYTTDPTVLTGIVKILQSVVSYFGIKK